MTPSGEVLIEGRAVGVSFLEQLQARGRYQLKPALPLVPDSEVAIVVWEVTHEAGAARADRGAAITVLGGWAEVAVAPAMFTSRCPGALSFEQRAGRILN